MKICSIIALVCIAVLTAQAQTQARNQLLQTVNDPELSGYLTRLASNVIARTNTNVSCAVQVVDIESINAFAQPNGELYLTRGLLNAVANEAELVFVIAQQLSSLRPTSTAAYRRPEFKKPGAGHTILIGLISGAVIVLGGPAGAKAGAMIIAQEIGHRSHPRPVYPSIQTAPPALLLEADKFAVEYLHEAGYDPEAALSILATLRELRRKGYVKQSQLPASPVTFLERMRVVRNCVARLEQKDEYLLESSTFKALKKRLATNPLTTSSSH